MFTDDAISTETVQAAVPKATHLLCAFHIIDLNITKVANKCKYAHAERLQTILWSKVAHARCVTDLQQTVRVLEDLRVPKPVAASLQYFPLLKFMCFVGFNSNFAYFCLIKLHLLLFHIFHFFVYDILHY